jgi:hypothetical protein
VVVAVSMALRKRNVSGRELSRRIAGEGSPGWWSKRYNGELALTVTDLGDIADAIDVPIAELLGIPTTEPLDPVVHDTNEFLKDTEFPRSVRDNVREAVGLVLSLALTNQLSSRRRTVARGRAAVKGRKTRG